MKLYIGNLSQATVESDLLAIFESVGRLVSLNIIKDKYSGQSRGFGFVEFTSQQDASVAIEKYNGHEVNGEKLRVSEAREKSTGSGSQRPKRW